MNTDINVKVKTRDPTDDLPHFRACPRNECDHSGHSLLRRARPALSRAKRYPALYSPQYRVRLELTLCGKRIGFSLAECKELIELYDPSHGNRKQLETFMAKIAERRNQLVQQLLDIQQMQLELDTAEERCLNALTETDKKQGVTA